MVFLLSKAVKPGNNTEMIIAAQDLVQAEFIALKMQSWWFRLLYWLGTVSMYTIGYIDDNGKFKRVISDSNLSFVGTVRAFRSSYESEKQPPVWVNTEHGVVPLTVEHIDYAELNDKIVTTRHFMPGVGKYKRDLTFKKKWMATYASIVINRAVDIYKENKK